MSTPQRGWESVDARPTSTSTPVPLTSSDERRDEERKHRKTAKIRSEGVIMERSQMGPVEKAIRSRVSAGAVPSTPTGRGRFTVAEIANKGPALLLGRKG